MSSMLALSLVLQAALAVVLIASNWIFACKMLQAALAAANALEVSSILF